MGALHSIALLKEERHNNLIKHKFYGGKEVGGLFKAQPIYLQYGHRRFRGFASVFPKHIRNNRSLPF